MLRIAVLDDDEEQRELLRSIVESMHFVCHAFGKGRDLLAALRRETYDAFIVDWGVPDLSGLEIVKWIRANVSATAPVLFVTNRAEERDVIQALNAGADDYMTKPVRVQELMARVQALLRRAFPERRQEVRAFGDYVFDQAFQSVSLRGVEIPLKNKEFELAYVLFSNADQLLSRGYLMDIVWGQNSDVTSRTLDTHVSRLRSKLELKPENGFMLTTVYGVGYRLRAIADAPVMAPGTRPNP